MLASKILELEGAFQEAAREGDYDLAAMYNKELIHHLLKMADDIRDTATNSGTNSGEQ